MSLRSMIVAAVTTACLSCVLPLVAGDKGFGAVMVVSLTLSILWLVIAVQTIRNYGKPGWWTMLGLPALFWPYWTVALIYACAVRHSCL